jgi:O-antigen ligase
MKILQVAKNYKIIIFCLLNFFSIFTLLTVSATPEGLLNFNLIRNNFLENVQIIKSIIPIIILISLLLLTIKEFKIFLKKKISIIFILFSLLVTFQILGTATTSQNYLKNLYYIIPIINTLLLSLILFKMTNKNDFKVFLYSNLLIFFLIFLYFYLIYLKNYFTFNNNLYSIWGTIKDNENVPRPTGMARIIFVFSAYFLCRYLVKKRGLLLLIFFNYLVFGFQSRIVIASLLLITLIAIFIKAKSSFREIFKYIILIIIIPIILSITVDFLKKNILFSNQTLGTSYYLRLLDPVIIKENITSNRLSDWKNILINYENKKIFGYGIHGDRILIKQTASNGFLYSIASGGYIAGLIYLIISIYSLNLAIRSLLNKKINQYSWFSSSLIIFFLLRSIVENSFAIIGYDFIIFYFAVFYLEKKNFSNFRV